MNGIPSIYAPVHPISAADKIEASNLNLNNAAVASTTESLSQAGDSDYKMDENRPKLEPPSIDSNKWQKGAGEISSTLGGAANIAPEATKKDVNVSEIQLSRSLIECIRKEQSSIEESAEITAELVQQKQDASKKIKEEYFNKGKELSNQKKKAHKLKWVDRLLYGLAFAGAFASAGLLLTATVPTGGAAIPLAIKVTIGVFHGLLSLAEGAKTIYNGFLKYDTKKILGDLEMIKWNRELIIQKIKTWIEEMCQSMEEIANYWQQLFTIVYNQQKAKRIHT